MKFNEDMSICLLDPHHLAGAGSTLGNIDLDPGSKN